MRIVKVDPEYARWLEGELGELADRARLDKYRRQNGHPPIIPDFAIDQPAGDDAVVLVETVAVVTRANDRLPEVVRAVTDAVQLPRARRRA